MLSRIKKGALLMTTRAQAERDDRAYWASRSMEERLAALEVLRRMTYPDAASPPRLRRVSELTYRKRR